MRCLATKEVKIPQIFKYMMLLLPWKQNSTFKTSDLICLKGVCVCSTVKAVLGLFYVFYKNCVNMNVGGVNNTT